MICQLERCSGVAWRSLGYQARGTEMTRPSMSSTVRKSSDNEAVLTRSSARVAKIPIPSLQKHSYVLFYDAFDLAELVRAEPEIASQSDRFEPEFRREFIAIDVDVRWFIRFVAEEIETVRTEP
jgi:hypothetical protein